MNAICLFSASEYDGSFVPLCWGVRIAIFYLDSYIFSMTYKIVSLFILYSIPSRFCYSFLVYGVRNI